MTPQSKVPFWRSFGRAQVSSFLATLVDYGALFLLVESAGLYYVYATAVGAFCGAVTNFLLNRYWSFETADRPAQGQALRYAFVSGGSLVLNTGAVYILTDYAGLKYGFSKVIASLVIGVVFNFPLHRRYVFK